MEKRTIYLTLALPNEEVKYIYEHTIQEWTQTKIKAYDFSAPYTAVTNRDSTILEEQIRTVLRDAGLPAEIQPGKWGWQTRSYTHSV